MNRISFTLITRDEEHNLPRALTSVKELADEILVVDSGSQDRTCQVARSQGARVIERGWTDYSDQKNFAAAQAAHDWIFSLDADEELSPALAAALGAWKTRAPDAVAYRMRRKARYLGGWIHHSGWYPVGRLHESLEVSGAVGWLEGDLLHHTFDTLDAHKAAVRRYTSLAAEDMWTRGRRRWLLPLFLASPWAFVRTLVLQQGFRDGYRGVLISWMAAYYVFLKYFRLGRMKSSHRSAPLPTEPRP
jgi:glycosyltransferase involved in cell wall biosynthesis